MSGNNKSIIWEQIILQSSIICLIKVYLGSKTPPAREGSIFTFVPEKNSIIVFAGQGTNRYSDLYLFDIISKQWIEEKSKGLPPPSVSHAASWFDFPYLFFQGGRSNQDKALADTYFLDVETYTWRKLFTMEQPSSRYGHKAVRNDDKQAYVFGGCNIGKKEHRFLNDLHKCEYKSIKIVDGEESNVNGASWITNVACKGVKPAGRKGHSMVLIANNIFLFGGELKQGITDENMYKFSIDDKEWSIVSIQGDKLPLSAYSCLIQINIATIVIIGGKGKEELSNEIYSIDIKSNECSKLHQTGVGPDKRSDYMSCLTKDNNIILFGGSNNEGLCHMDVYLLQETKEIISNVLVKEEKGIANKTESPQASRQINIIQPQQQQQQPQSISQLQPQSQSKQSKPSSPQKRGVPLTEQQQQSNRGQKSEALPKKSYKKEVNLLKELQAQFIKEYEKNAKITKI